MHAGTAFVADREATKPMQPCEGPFDDPAGPAQTATVRGAALGELGRDAALLQVVTVWARLGFRAGRPARPPSGGIASTSGSNWVMSCRSAAVKIVTSGIPCASVRT